MGIVNTDNKNTKIIRHGNIVEDLNSRTKAYMMK